jgi:DnaK suppressor protein
MHSDELLELLATELARLDAIRSALLRDGLADEQQRTAGGELSGMDEHVADVASETFEREAEIGLLHTVDAELADVRAAMVRALAGEYGRCLVCHGPIGDDRLRAVPAATRCVAHQRDAEREEDASRDDRAARRAAREATSHLDFLPTEEPGAALVAAEEAAMHVVTPA